MTSNEIVETAFGIAFVIPVGIAFGLYILRLVCDYDLIQDLRRLWK